MVKMKDFRKFIRCNLGSGEACEGILIWEDPWCGNNPLNQDLSISFNLTVDQRGSVASPFDVRIGIGAWDPKCLEIPMIGNWMT